MQKISFIFCALSIIFISCKKKDPIANFSFSSSHGAPVTVFFNNSSENCDTYSWEFGDNEYSIEESPQHLYLYPGNYEVKLTASGDKGVATKTKNIEVTGTTYEIYNNTSSVLYEIVSYHVSDGQINDLRSHGNIAVKKSSNVEGTEHDEISVSFYFSDGTKAVVANPFSLVKEEKNIFEINKNTQIYVFENDNLKNTSLPKQVNDLPASIKKLVTINDIIYHRK